MTKRRNECLAPGCTKKCTVAFCIHHQRYKYAVDQELLGICERWAGDSDVTPKNWEYLKTKVTPYIEKKRKEKLAIDLGKVEQLINKPIAWFGV